MLLIEVFALKFNIEIEKFIVKFMFLLINDKEKKKIKKYRK